MTAGAYGALARVLEHFPDARQVGSNWQVRCPAHDDRKASLSIAQGEKGVLLNCKANCATADVVAAMGLTMQDLFDDAPRPRRQQSRIVAEYDYRDEAGAVLFQAVRFEPKDFRQRRVDAQGNVHWNLQGVRRVLFRLPELLAARPAQSVFVVEGEKDALALSDGPGPSGSSGFGLVATTCPMGAGKWRPEYVPALAGRKVVILPDNDEPGRKHAREVAASLHGQAASVKIVELPGLPPKGDVSDWIHAGGTRQELRQLTEETPAWSPEREPAPRDEQTPPAAADSRPVIVVQGGDLPRMVSEAEQALIASEGPRIYQRGALVRAIRQPSLTVRDGVTRHPGALMVQQLDTPYLVERLTVDADWQVYDGRSKGHRRCDCPEKVARSYLARVGDWRVPSLIGIIEAPTLRPDGSLLTEPGYDERTGLLLDTEDARFDAISADPDAGAIRNAVEAFRGLLQEFPFVEETDRAAAVAALLTGLVRRSLPSAPMFGFRAPKMRSGKTMLADCVALLATGRPCAVMSQAKDQEEEKKRLLSALLAGDPVLCYDNIDREFGGAAISQALTQAVISDRLLGQSRTVSVPTATTFLATGNNLTFAGDITARVVPCDLDPEMEHPEERLFTRNLYEWIPAHRGELVAAALTILRGYQAAGRPEQGAPAWAGFNAWCRMVRDAVMWAGFADPTGGRGRLEDTDPVRVQLNALLATWNAYIGADRVTAAEVLNRCKSDGYGGLDSPDRAALRAAIVEIAGSRGDVIDPRRFGKYLRDHRNRIEGGLRALNVGIRAGVAIWQVRPVVALMRQESLRGLGGSGGSPPCATRENVTPPIESGTEGGADSFGRTGETNPPNPPNPLDATNDQQQDPFDVGF